MPAHRDLIVEQFTKQAVPFSTAPGVRDEEALRLLVDFTGAGPEDTVLDVACGPGLVVCALAAVVRHAIGIDVTPAMVFPSGVKLAYLSAGPRSIEIQ